MVKTLLRIGIGVLFAGAGLVHFTHAEFFSKLVPAGFVEYRDAVNFATGVLMIAMGLAFIVPRFHAVARWSSIALLVATLPAAVKQVIDPAGIETLGLTPALATARIVAQLFMIGIIWWLTKPPAT
jgi:uncharacterized membrane protein